MTGDSRPWRATGTKLRAAYWLAGLVIVVGAVFTTYFLIRGVNGGRAGATALGVALLAASVAETGVTLGLVRLRPSMWYGGLTTFGAGSLLGLVLLLLETRLLSAVYLLASVATVGAIYLLRPLYVPGSAARERVVAERGEGSTAIGKLRRSDASLQLRAYVLFVLLAATVSFVKGSLLFFQGETVPTYVGLVYVTFALMQVRACYGLWLGRRSGWFLSVLLCSIVTLVAFYHAVVAEDAVSVAIFVLDATNVAYLYSSREKYVPGLTIDLTPR